MVSTNGFLAMSFASSLVTPASSPNAFTPMAMLEDVLVPVYFYHRYQLEAATKLIGGMHYTYALKGDGQVVTAPLEKSKQAAAMSSIARRVLDQPGHIAIVRHPPHQIGAVGGEPKIIQFFESLCDEIGRHDRLFA